LIYIVEDDVAVQDSLRALLEAKRLETRGFGSAEAFLVEPRAPDGNDCLVVDLHLPGISGLNLVEELRRRGDHILTIVMTGYPSARKTARSQAAGALAIVEKPFDPIKIVTLIQAAVSPGRVHKP
jgi:FixJ family two-component response regulator